MEARGWRGGDGTRAIVMIDAAWILYVMEQLRQTDGTLCDCLVSVAELNSNFGKMPKS